MMGTLVRVTAEWDSEAHVWVASSADVPGLVTEAEEIGKLCDRIGEIIPDLLERAVAFELTAVFAPCVHGNA